MRNPLHALIGTIDLIANTDREELDPKLIKSGKFSGELLLTLIGNILDFSKIQAHKMEAVMTSIDLREKISNILSMFENRAKTNNLYLKAIIDPKLPSALEADGQKLNQVLINLIGNSMKFTLHGGIVINVEWIELDEVELDQSTIKQRLNECFLLSSRSHFFDQIDEHLDSHTNLLDLQNRRVLTTSPKKELGNSDLLFS